MKISESFSMAFQNIKSNKMRSFLTMLGIILGISAVMVIMALGNGMQIYMEDQFSSLGSDTLSVSVLGRGSTYHLKEQDMYNIVEKHPELYTHLSPTVSMNSKIKVGTESLDKTSCTGVSEEYFDIKHYEIEKGRNLIYMDIKKRTYNAVIGKYISKTYYNDNPIGKTIRIGTNEYTIVGVMAKEDETMEEGGTDDCIFIPYSTAARLSYSGTLSSYTVQITSKDVADSAKSTLEDELLTLFKTEDAYMVISMTQILDIMNKMLNITITILALIAGISLVVGGVGIMNIMLVSVSERTKEIGIRKALGAKEKYILSQFVIEAAMTAAIGGIIGIIFGYVFSAIASVLVVSLTETTMQITPTLKSIMIAFGTSAAIGIVFGYLPARKAASLNPIDALRFE